MVHSALIQYLSLDINQLFLEYLQVLGENHQIGVARRQIHDDVPHVMRAHHGKEVQKAIQQGYRKDNVFSMIFKPKQANDNFVIDKGLIYLKKEGTMQKLRIPDSSELKTKILYEFHDSATPAHPGAYRTYMKLKQLYYWPRYLRRYRT